MALFQSGLAQNGEAIDDGLLMIDFMALKEGKSIKDRDKYDKWIRRIAKRYGMETVQSYELGKNLSGLLDNAAKLNIWRLPNKEALKQLGADPIMKS